MTSQPSVSNDHYNPRRASLRPKDREHRENRAEVQDHRLALPYCPATIELTIVRPCLKEPRTSSHSHNQFSRWRSPRVRSPGAHFTQRTPHKSAFSQPVFSMGIPTGPQSRRKLALWPGVPIFAPGANFPLGVPAFSASGSFRPQSHVSQRGSLSVRVSDNRCVRFCR